MQPCDRERLGREVDARYPGAASGHALGEQAAAAADIQHPAAGESRAGVDVIEAGGIEVVQGAKLPFGVPPARRRRVEFRDLRRVEIPAVFHPGSIRAVVKFAASWAVEKTTKSA